MIAHRVLDFLVTILSPLVVVLQIVTTFLLGILVSMSFGLLLFPISFLWMLQLGLLLGLSWFCNKLPLLRNVIGFLGIPFALVAEIFVCLMPSMGEVESRAVKMLLCESWPFTWEFWEFRSSRVAIESRDASHLQNIITRITRNDEIKQRVIQRIIDGEQLDTEVSTVTTAPCREEKRTIRETMGHDESTDDTKIRFRCPHCQAKYSALLAQVGKQSRCKKCGGRIEVPKPQGSKKHPGAQG